MSSTVVPDSVQSRAPRVRGLDTLRFFLALWVVLRHFGFIPMHFDESRTLGKLAAGVTNNLFCGPAAVIVFFVISGFCIHYPYRNGRKPQLIPYFARRHLRIWTPIVIAVLIARPFGVSFDLLHESVLWSLLAEEIYYLIYPALHAMRQRFGWDLILTASYVAALVVILSNPLAKNYSSYGPLLNWVLGLPCWLLGCRLVEGLGEISLAPSISPRQIWQWRIGMWGLSSFASALRFHSPIGFPWSLTLFAPIAYLWLRNEIFYYRDRTPPRIFESAGRGSYSIYLVHLIGGAMFVSMHLALGSTASWFAQLAFTLLLSATFYFLVEKPSHAMARQLALRLSRNAAPAIEAPAITEVTRTAASIV